MPEIYNRKLPNDLDGVKVIHVEVDRGKWSVIFTYIVSIKQGKFTNILQQESLRLDVTYPQIATYCMALADHWNAYLLYNII